MAIKNTMASCKKEVGDYQRLHEKTLHEEPVYCNEIDHQSWGKAKTKIQNRGWKESCSEDVSEIWTDHIHDSKTGSDNPSTAANGRCAVIRKAVYDAECKHIAIDSNNALGSTKSDHFTAVVMLVSLLFGIRLQFKCTRTVMALCTAAVWFGVCITLISIALLNIERGFQLRFVWSLLEAYVALMPVFFYWVYSGLAIRSKSSKLRAIN